MGHEKRMHARMDMRKYIRKTKNAQSKKKMIKETFTVMNKGVRKGHVHQNDKLNS